MRLLRKYENRRLYDPTASRYVNLEDIARMVREGEDVRVEDTKTGADLTREVLLQVVLEVHGGLDFLPTGLLRRIIRATGEDPAQRLVRRQLATALGLLHDQLDRFEQSVRPPPPPPKAPPPPPPRAPPPKAPPPPADEDDEMRRLRERLSALEARLKE